MGDVVLVTGGAWFLGSHLARRLVQGGRRVVAYHVRVPGPGAAWVLKPVAVQVSFLQGDVDNWARLRQVFAEHRSMTVVHPVYLAREPLEAVRVDLGGTINVLEAARFFQLRTVRLVFAAYESAARGRVVSLARSGADGRA